MSGVRAAEDSTTDLTVVARHQITVQDSESSNQNAWPMARRV